MSEKEFIVELEKIGIVLNEKKLDNLKKYYELLIDYNKHTNLTRITEQKEVYLKHFYDSLTIVKEVKLSNQKVLDIGTGAGFPGMVLKIVFNDLDVTLVDSLNKRIKFLEEVKNKLKLDKITIVHARAEEYIHNNRESFDIVTSRAVAKLNVLAELCLPYVKINGLFIPMKSSLDDELLDSISAINKLGGKILSNTSFSLPVENSTRTILVIEKKVKTNVKYPRKFSEIKRKPL